MKHVSTLLTTILLSASASAAEPEAHPGAPEARRTVLGILINPSQLGVLTLQGERVLSPRVSVGLGVSAGISRAGFRAGPANLQATSTESDSSGYLVGAGPLARFFLTGTAPEGLWLSPQLDVMRSSTEGENRGSADFPWTSVTESRAWSFGGSALVGYSAIVGDGLAVQVGAGLEARYERGQGSSRFTPPPGSGELGSETAMRVRSWSLHERVALSVGWAF